MADKENTVITAQRSSIHLLRNVGMKIGRIEHIPAAESGQRTRAQMMIGTSMSSWPRCVFTLNAHSRSREKMDPAFWTTTKTKKRQQNILQGGAPGNYSRVTSNFRSSKFLFVQTELDEHTFSFIIYMDSEVQYCNRLRP